MAKYLIASTTYECDICRIESRIIKAVGAPFIPECCVHFIDQGDHFEEVIGERLEKYKGEELFYYFLCPPCAVGHVPEHVLLQAALEDL